MNNKKIAGNVVGVPNPKLTKTSQLINDSGFVTDLNYVHTDNNLTNSLRKKINDAYKIAVGANQAITFYSYKDLVEFFNKFENSYIPGTGSQFSVGQNVYIHDIDVPDLWISDVTNDIGSLYEYEFIDNEKFISDLRTWGSVTIGVVSFSMLETQKADLTEYPTKEEMNEAIKSGGGASYDLIQTITIGDDDVTTFTFNKDVNGDSFKLDAVSLRIDCATVPNSKLWRVSTTVSSDTLLFYFKPDTTGKTIILKSERMCDGFWFGVRSRNTQELITNAPIYGSYCTTDVDYIESLYLNFPEIPAGTVITVCGRRR